MISSSPRPKLPDGLETLTLSNTRASGGSTRKASASYAASQGLSTRQIMEVGDWAHRSPMNGHPIRCLPKEDNVAKVITDNPQ